VEATILYLRVRTDSESREALEYIQDCIRAGNFDDMEGWASFREQYFRGVKPV
jgi:hypothetical protein